MQDQDQDQGSATPQPPVQPYSPPQPQPLTQQSAYVPHPTQPAPAPLSAVSPQPLSSPSSTAPFAQPVTVAPPDLTIYPAQPTSTTALPYSQTTESPMAPTITAYTSTAPVATPQPSPPSPLPEQPIPASYPTLPPSGSNKKRLTLIGGIVGLLVLLGVGGFLVFQSITDATSVKQGDLVATTSQHTTYLRPKQWPQGKDDSYGVSLNTDSKHMAMIHVNESEPTTYDFTSADETTLQQLRQFTLDRMTDTVITNNLKNDSFCTETKNITRSVGSRQSKTILSLVKIEADCESNYGLLHIKMDIWLGKDKILRNMIIAASSDIWKKNQAVFDTMIQSGDVKQ